MNMANMAKGGFSRAAIEEMQQSITKPLTEVRQQTKWGFQFPGHKMVKAAIERHLWILSKNHMDSCLPCQNGTAKNSQTHWSRRGTGTPPPELAAPPPRTPPPTGTPPPPGLPRPPNTQCFNHNAYAKSSKRYTEFIPDLLSRLSPAWKYHWHRFWLQQQPFERIWE
jgi:hypothetical protein